MLAWGSRDVDPPRGAVGRLRTGNRQHTIAQVGLDAVAIDGQRQLEGPIEAAMAALDAVVLLAGDAAFGALPGNDDVPVVHLDLDILTAKTGHFRGDHVVAGRLVDVDGGNPAGRPGCEPVEPLLK